MSIVANNQGGLTFFDVAVIVVYLLVMLYMGLRIARKQRSTEDFFVGGRDLPAWAVGISLFASVMSTILYLGQPGEMFRTGLTFLTRQLPLPLILIVVCFVWIPFFMRLRLTSAYEYLERRFNYPVRALAAIFCLLLIFGWISVVVLTASMALVEITRIFDFLYHSWWHSCSYLDGCNTVLRVTYWRSIYHGCSCMDDWFECRRLDRGIPDL